MPDWFSPDLAIDKGGNVIVTANDSRHAPVGPSLAVMTRKAIEWQVDRCAVRRAWYRGSQPGRKPDSVVELDWCIHRPHLAVGRVGVGVVGNQSVVNGMSTKIARVSLAKNKASIKASSTRVKKGSKVTFTVKLSRPDSKDTIKGLPVALQKSPKSRNTFKTVKSGKTSAKGTAQWKLKVSKASKYRTLGKAVQAEERRWPGLRLGEEQASDGEPEVVR